MSKNVPTFEVYMSFNELSKTKAKELRSLSNKKERDKQGLFIAEGNKCVRDIIDAFGVEHLICTSDWLQRNSGIAIKYQDKILRSDKKNIEIISTLSSIPDVIAVLKKGIHNEEIPILNKNKLYVLLEEIQDPGNLGTIIRTCDWFGVYDIYASKNTVDVYSPKVIQSTMGSLSRVKVHYLDLEELIIKNREIRLIGTVLNGIPLSNTRFNNGAMLLMGNEGKGISQKLLNLITDPVTIPPVNPVNHPDSLNVAIATSICLYYLSGNISNLS